MKVDLTEIERASIENLASKISEDFIDGFRLRYTDCYEPDIVCIMSGGIHAEGQRILAYATSPAVAVELLEDAYKKYRESHQGTILVWRSKPEMESVTYFVPAECTVEGRPKPLTFYIAWMRLAIR